LCLSEVRWLAIWTGHYILSSCYKVPEFFPGFVNDEYPRISGTGVCAPYIQICSSSSGDFDNRCIANVITKLSALASVSALHLHLRHSHSTSNDDECAQAYQKTGPCRLLSFHGILHISHRSPIPSLGVIDL
jgi:hypothetical protein